jgi:predicted DNA-binding transcriptional regulator YafY
MSAALQVLLTDAQLDDLAERIARRMQQGSGKKSVCTLAEAAAALQVSPSTVRRMMKAGQLTRVPGIAKPLISAAQIEYLTHAH